MSKWPWPGDNATERARRIANSLLALLPAEEQPEWIARAHELGETWFGEGLVIYTPDQAINTAQAAQLIGVSQDVIRQWACKPHPEDPGRKLLPRFKKQGNHRTYLAGDVLDAAAALRRQRVEHHLWPA